MGSSGGGSSRPPNQATPSGTITPFGSATPWEPSYNNVLPSSGWATVEGVEGAMNNNAAQQQAQQAAARAAAPVANPMTDPNAFAQKLLDYQKQQQFGKMMLGFGPQGLAQGIQAMRAPAPKPSNPMEQLMMQALQSRQMSSMAGNGRSMASYRR